MQRVLYYIVVVAILAVFVVIMNAGDYMKKPRTQADNFPLHLQLVTRDIEKGDWELAKENRQRLEGAWKKIMPRIQFSVEKDEMTAIDFNLARLDAYIQARDRSNALAELKEAAEHWRDLNR
jgi:hypothetical protein